MFNSLYSTSLLRAISLILISISGVLYAASPRHRTLSKVLFWTAVAITYLYLIIILLPLTFILIYELGYADLLNALFF